MRGAGSPDPSGLEVVVYSDSRYVVDAVDKEMGVRLGA